MGPYGHRFLRRLVPLFPPSRERFQIDFQIEGG